MATKKESWMVELQCNHCLEIIRAVDLEQALRARSCSHHSYRQCRVWDSARTKNDKELVQEPTIVGGV